MFQNRSEPYSKTKIFLATYTGTRKFKTFFKKNSMIPKCRVLFKTIVRPQITEGFNYPQKILKFANFSKMFWSL